MAQPHRVALLLGGLALMFAGLLPAPSLAAPGAALYVGHHARLTAEIPRAWAVDPTGAFDYFGADGFVISRPLAGQTLDEACASLGNPSHLDLFDAPAATSPTSWEGQPACQVEGQIGGADAVGIVMPHPRPFELWDEQYAFAAVIADPEHVAQIAATIDFSPDRVTPERYATSLLALVEARAYWSPHVDWNDVRHQVLGFIDGLPTVEMARQGTLNILLENLRLAGDNHSHAWLPNQVDYLSEARGYGLVVGGHRVIAVFPDGPGARAGIRPGDVIEAVNGRPFQPMELPGEPIIRVPQTAAEDANRPVTWTIRRQGLPLPITVTIAPGSYSRYLPPNGFRLSSDLGYLSLHHATDPGRDADYASMANQILATLDRPSTCGWVIDLRLDYGGSYSPTITGVGPILGDGAFVGWLAADGSQSWVSYDDGRITDDGTLVADYLGPQQYTLKQPNPPVAVLTSSITASAGEVATLAFVGRPETRLFGETTRGLTSANAPFPLFDGSQFALATAAMTDRTGTTHLSGVAPDESIETDWATFGTPADRVLIAAIDWLNQQPACAT